MPDFPIWPECNIGCVFCSNPVEGYRETTEKYSFEKLKAKLARYKDGLKTFVKFDQVRDTFTLTGGEPTLHPDFHRLLAHIRAEFPGHAIRLLSNGRMFSYETFARRTMIAGQTPFEVAVPIFGGDARSHEATSRTPGSFEQTVRGLENLFRFRKPEQRIEIRVIVTRIQLKSLEGLLQFLLKRFPEIDHLVFLFVELEGFGEAYKDRVKLSMTEAASAIDSHFGLLERFKEVRLYHFPLCAVPLRLWPRVNNTLDDFKIMFNDDCRNRCVHKRHCGGIHRSYERFHGTDDLKPILEAQPVQETGNRYQPFDRVLDAVPE